MDATPRIIDGLPDADDQSIGAILVQSGRLRPEDAETILQKQKATGEPFGIIAAGLGLVTRDDIDFALARQYEYPYLPPGNGIVSPAVVVAYQPFGEVAERMRALRSQIALRWLKGRMGPKTLAITGVGRGEGRSFVAANLAVVFAQMGARTLLIDADLRHPAQHGMFLLNNRMGLSSLLANRAGSEAIVRIAPLRNLYVLPAGPIPPNPQELLGRALFMRQLRALEGLFDVIILDTAAYGAAADGQIVAAASGAALMVVRKDVTPMNELRAFQATLDASGSHVLGAVVNRR